MNHSAVVFCLPDETSGKLLQPAREHPPETWQQIPAKDSTLQVSSKKTIGRSFSENGFPIQAGMT
ncbi:MAG TPA: hypothetical protein DCX79_15650, partial [Planctomycetaceae bacterium]|nr:hypothetical protein [Planctomycetaceae bacterium]